MLVCAPTTKELAALAPELFGDGSKLEELRPMSMRLKDRNVIFLVTGVGPINAALAVGHVLGLIQDKPESKIEAILLAGLAGAFHLDKTPLKSLWAVQEEIWPEYGLNDGARVTARAFSFAQWDRDGQKIYDSVPLAVPEQSDGKKKEALWPSCRSLTVAGVSASFQRRDALWTTYHAELENMEGFAVAYVALRADLPCYEVRAVSNKVGPRSRDEKDFDGALKALGQILPAFNIL